MRTVFGGFYEQTDMLAINYTEVSTNPVNTHMGSFPNQRLL